MPSTIITKNGSGAPLAADLVAGELAVDLTNGRLYTEDSGGSVIEIGLNPSGNVDVTGTVSADGLIVTATVPSIQLTDSDNNADAFIQATDGNVRFYADDNNEAADSIITFNIDGSEVARLDSSGNLSLNSDGSIAALDGVSGMQIGNSTASSAGLALDTLNNGYLMYVSGTSLKFWDSTDNTDRLILDGNGNLLVGSTDTNPWNNSAGSSADNGIFMGGGRIGCAMFGGVPLLVNRTGGDGDLTYWYSDGSLVGGITTNSSRFELDGFGNPVRIKAGTSNIQVNNNTHISFDTAGSERARIDASGSLLVGTASAISGNKHCFVDSTIDTTVIIQKSSSDASYLPLAVWHTATSGNNLFVKFFTEGSATERGNIDYNRTGNQVRYNVTSDQRLKENIVDASSASDDIDAIKVRQFDWVENGYHQSYGLIAQELLTVVPDAVSSPEDPEEMMGVDYSKLVPMMLKEIQSLRARVAQLEGVN